MKKVIIMASTAIAGTLMLASCACNNNSKKAEDKTPAAPEYTEVEKACVDLSQFKKVAED